MRLVKPILGIASCIGLAWLVVRTSVVYALAEEKPAAVALIVPNDPRVIVELAMDEFSRSGGLVSRSLHEAIMAGLPSIPLAPEPFILAGIDALAENDPRAEVLLREARRRHPRSRITHLLLLDGQLRAGRLEDAVSTMNTLTRLIPGAEPVLVAQLAEIARTRSTRPTIKNLIERDSRIKNRLLEYLASDAKDPELILELAGPAAAPAGSAPAPIWQQKLISALIDRGEAQRAYRLWARFSGLNGASPKPLINDSEFRAAPGLLPFNWRFVESNGGVAERSSAGGLQVQYYGRDAATLVDQLLLLSPGRYRLSSAVEVGASTDAPPVTWRVTCNQGERLLDMNLVQGRSEPTISQEFTVPAGCASQWVALTGNPAEFAKPVSLMIRKINLEKVG